MRTVLINIWRPSFFNEDPDLILNADAADPTYQYVGSDSEPNNRDARATFAFNYFRLGELAFDQNPTSSVQRRIVIANGSTSELLFNFLPTGTGSEVQSQITAQAENIINAINSVEFAPEVPVDLSIEITDFQLEEDGMTLQFESAPGLTGFSVWMSPTPDMSLGSEVKANSVITEISPGVYEAAVSGVKMPETLFACVQLD